MSQMVLNYRKRILGIKILKQKRGFEGIGVLLHKHKKPDVRQNNWEIHIKSLQDGP